MNETAIYEIRLKDSFSSPLSGLERKMDGFESKLGSVAKTALGVFGGGILISGVEGIMQGVKDLTFKIVGLGAAMEQTKISFTTMLGSAERANKTIAELVKFAEITPFGQKEVIQGARQLLAYGFAAENLTTDLRRLGDISAGLSIPIGDLVYLYGTIRTQGRAMTKDLMQFANRGIPIYDTLAKITGKSGMALQKMVEEGEIGFDVIEKAFIEMTKQGSMFGGLMEKQSRSLSGRWATFTDKLEVMGTTLGTKTIPALGQVLEHMISFVDIIPKIDFKPFTQNMEDIGASLLDTLSIVRDLFAELGLISDKTSAFQGLVSYLGALGRIATTPLRILVSSLNIVVTAIKGALPIFEEFGSLLMNVFDRNWQGVKDNAKRMKGMIVDFASTMKDSFVDIAEREAEAWKRIFNPVTTGDSSYADGTGSASKGGAGSSTTNPNGKDTTAGVEKIHAGTRNITINIGKLVESVKFESTNGQSQAQLMQMIQRALIASVNDANIVAQ